MMDARVTLTPMERLQLREALQDRWRDARLRLAEIEQAMRRLDDRSDMLWRHR